MELLSASEQRVIGVLIEKEKTTPDQYPLSLNALTTGCNQKSNREPVMSLSENIVQDTCNALIRKHLLIEESAGQGSRVSRYRHRFCNTEFSELQLSDQELALFCVLFLRGPQTPGELRTRTNRLCLFDSVGEVEAQLNALMRREPAPLIVKLEREAGKRESRYMHLFGGKENLAQFSVATEPVPADISIPPNQLEERVSALEKEVAALKSAIEALSQ